MAAGGRYRAWQGLPGGPPQGSRRPGERRAMDGPERAMRIRLRFAKTGKIRWTSHRDVARMWERAFRRVGLPLAYTQGFSPRPKVSFGLALPTGHESAAEYLDLELAADNAATAEVDISSLPARLSLALPAGIDVQA